MMGGWRCALPVLLIYVLSTAYVAARFVDGSPVDSNILSLLPETGNDPILAAAMRQAGNVASARIGLAVEGEDISSRRAAAQDLETELEKSGLFINSEADGRELYAYLFAHRTEQLCPADRVTLKADHATGVAIAEDAIRQWYGLFSAPDSRLLATDPLLLSMRLFQCTVLATLKGAGSDSAVLLSGRLTRSPFSLEVEDALDRVLSVWGEGHPGFSVARAGAVFDAGFGARQARQDISLISTLTTIAILALYLGMFRRLRPVLIAVCMVGAALATGVAATLLIFGTIHALALLFGAALVGMVVDYTTYYLVTGLGAEVRSRESRICQIFRPLTLGMMTSVGAFAVLWFFPITAFREIGVLGGVGLLAAWAGAIMVVPLVEGKPKPPGALARALSRIGDRFLGRSPRIMRWSGPVIAGGLLLLACFYGRTLDDVRRFQAPSAVLRAEEARVAALSGLRPGSRFFLVRGQNAEEATRNEERMMTQLGTARGRLIAASHIAPSMWQRGADREMIRTGLIDAQLPDLVRKLGAGNAAAYATVGQAAEAPLPKAVVWLRGQTMGQSWSIVPLPGDVVLPAVVPDATWQIVDPAAVYSRSMRRFRQFASLGLAAAFISTGLILLAVYRRWDALWLLGPCFLALIVALCVPPLLGMPVSFFSFMGAFLVIGAGVDYSIFQWEHGAEASWTRVGIMIAAGMTTLSIGLLGASGTYPVRAYGVTVAIGIILSLYLSSMMLEKPHRD